MPVVKFLGDLPGLQACSGVQWHAPTEVWRHNGCGMERVWTVRFRGAVPVALKGTCSKGSCGSVHTTWCVWFTAQRVGHKRSTELR